jgi:adenosylhomocysteine nucleosidase
MPMEARRVARSLSLRRTVVGGRRGYRGALGAGEAVLAVTGMGPERAAAGTEAMVAECRPDAVIVAGICGALEDRMAIGTVVAPAVVVDGATGREYHPAPLAGLQGAGVLWTSAALITAPAELAALVDRGVVALDMETAAVAGVCEARGIRWSVVRAVSDRAPDGTVDDEVFRMSGPDGAPDPRAVARFVRRHPGRLPQLARMGRDAARAAAIAADVAARAGTALTAEGDG